MSRDFGQKTNFGAIGPSTLIDFETAGKDTPDGVILLIHQTVNAGLRSNPGGVYLVRFLHDSVRIQNIWKLLY